MACAPSALIRASRALKRSSTLSAASESCRTVSLYLSASARTSFVTSFVCSAAACACAAARVASLSSDAIISRTNARTPKNPTNTARTAIIQKRVCAHSRSSFCKSRSSRSLSYSYRSATVIPCVTGLSVSGGTDVAGTEVAACRVPPVLDGGGLLGVVDWFD